MYMCGIVYRAGCSSGGSYAFKTNLTSYFLNGTFLGREAITHENPSPISKKTYVLYLCNKTYK